MASGSLQPETAEETYSQRRAAKAAWDAAKAQVETRQAKIASALADIKVADSRRTVAKADVGRLEATMALAVVRAPFNGIITRRQINSGDTIKDAAVPLLTVMRSDKVRVVIDIPSMPPAVEQGDTAGLKASRQPGSADRLLPGEPFTGTIAVCPPCWIRPRDDARRCIWANRPSRHVWPLRSSLPKILIV